MSDSITSTVDAAGELPDTNRLAQQVLAHCSQSKGHAGSGVAAFPSERELAKHLGVTRHMVRNSLELLERRGVIRRLPGRGAFMFGSSESRPGPTLPLGLRCINFIPAPSLQDHQFQWMFNEYLAGYTQVLDLYDVKTRFVLLNESDRDFDKIFWPQAPPEEQACVLMNWRFADLLWWLSKRSIPYSVQNHCAYDDQGLPPHPRAYVNKMGGAFDATRHFLDLGHRNIGFVGLTPRPWRLTPEFEGFNSAMRCAGLTPRAEHFLDVTDDIGTATHESLDRFLASPDRPSAILASAGDIAVVTLRAAEKLGIRVPADLSLIGFNSIASDQVSNLSTVSVPRRELAKATIEVLLESIRHPDADELQNRILHCTFTSRGSTAKLR